ncbi:bestrophin-4-like [Belonocnema kinseyi]|uniref:bestrophin-4-like n=1 Tax=Belonocnema kinseyi TaxID=2817044 RepID=UPI00143D29EF|nr:bestrophin-4-like [Belonocnema kinseyi]
MTVSYTAEVATCRGLGCFLKLLLRWRASIYKLVWLDLALFLFIYYSLSAVYRFVLDDHQKKIFEHIVGYCNEHGNYIPLAFVLGFYVTIVMNRWWSQYTSIPWPDSIAVYVSATVHGNDERGRLMRRTIVRYVCVCLTLVLANVSPRVKKRFPTMEHFVDSGLLLENELSIFHSLNQKFPKPSKHWLPIVWASSIVTRARKEGRIRDDFAVKTLIDELNKFRGNCGSLIQYDNISIPLVYTQVVTLAVYTYFLSSVMGGQWIQDKPTAAIDLYFPFFTALQFFFYMGWLKVAETLINPFGEDDDDFEVNWLIDRNLQVSYLIVDEMHHEHPELIRDQYWDEVFPVELPYTAASEPFREEHPEPSTANIQLTAAQQEVLPSSVRIDEMVPPDYQQKQFRTDIAEDSISGIHFNVGKMSSSEEDPGTSIGALGGGGPWGKIFCTWGRLSGRIDVIVICSSTSSITPILIDPPATEKDPKIMEAAEPELASLPGVFVPLPLVPSGLSSLLNNLLRTLVTLPTLVMDPPIILGVDPMLIFLSLNQSARSSGVYDPVQGFTSDLNEEGGDDESIVSNQSTDSSVDEFTRLKSERLKERKQKALIKLARSISSNRESVDSAEFGDTDNLILTELANASRIAMQSAKSDNIKTESGPV